MPSWIRIILRYVCWALMSALALFILFISRTACLYLLVPLAESGFTGNARAILIQKVLFIGGAIGFLIFIILTEDYLRKGDEKKLLFTRIIRLLGAELLILSVLHASIAFSSGFSAVVLGLLGTEFIFGSALLGSSFQLESHGREGFSEVIRRFFIRKGK